MRWTGRLERAAAAQADVLLDPWLLSRQHSATGHAAARGLRLDSARHVDARATLSVIGLIELDGCRELDAVRAHVVRALDWEEAHVGFAKALEGVPAALRGSRSAGFEHSPAVARTHPHRAGRHPRLLRKRTQYVHTRSWPDDYWPRDPSPPSDAAWSESLAAVRAQPRGSARPRATPDLQATVPTGESPQTYLRALLLVVDHNAYHVVIVAPRRALERAARTALRVASAATTTFWI